MPKCTISPCIPLSDEIERAIMLEHVNAATTFFARGDVHLASNSLCFALDYASRLKNKEAESKIMRALNLLRNYARQHNIILSLPETLKDQSS